jgi:antitoxin ParD1/3/4
MNVSLSPEIDAWINEKVKSGMYNSSSEVIREGLRMLMEREEQRLSMLEDLRKELLIGVHQLDSGKSHAFDSNMVEKVKQGARKQFAL